MNQKKNTKILLILIIIIVIIILAGVGILVFATDIFKSDKEMFFKYMADIGDSKKGFIDDGLKQYFEKKNNTPYNDEGEFSVNISSDNEQKKFENVNNFNISFSGQVDTANSKAAQNISLNYSNDVKFPINYKQIENKIGLQTKYVGSKFVAIETEKLNKLSEDLDDVESYGEMVDKLQKMGKVELTEDEKSHIKDTYITVINQQLEKDKFSKVKESDMSGYKLSLTGTDLQNVLVKLLETLKNDQTTVDKLNEYLKIQKNSAKITASQIDDAIKSIKDDTDFSDKNFEIAVYQKNRDVCKLVIETTEGTIAIEKKIEGNQQNIVVSYEMKEDKKSKISFSANFENLESLQNIKENYELIMSLPEVAESSTTTDVDSEVVVYKFSNDVNFTDSATVEDFSSDNSLMLTDYDSDQVSNFLNAVVERISEVNEQQMGQLGLEASENPIVNMIPSIGLYLGNMNVLNQVNSNMSEAEINNFNQKFEAYESTNLKGVTVKGLLSTISLNNQSEETSNEIKEINYNGEEYEASEQNITLIKGEIDTEKSYRVEFEKDQDTGLIYRAVINEK
ncbi:unknown [Clostridium sp. CAG:343]|jgi:hypothetical protein|nr:unknown [Clostridium sp. CAG:343]HCF34763.1 hypothetical protein [Clostridiales bacterium]